MDARLENLERLGRLRDTGVLSADEFEHEKSRLISEATSSPANSTIKTVLVLATLAVVVAVGTGFAFSVVPEPEKKSIKHKMAAASESAQSAAPAQQTATTAIVERVTPQPVNPWIGKYKGAFEGGAKGSASISSRPGNKLAISIGIGSEDCSGGIDGTVSAPTAATAVIRKPKDDSGHACRLTLGRRGDRLTVTEDGCSYYHGFSCSFNGILTK